MKLHVEPHDATGNAAESLAPRHVHLLGVAGSGMRALAQVLVSQGWLVSGCDLDAAALASLSVAGLNRQCGHAATHLDGVDLLVYSDAVPPDHCERRAAAQRQIEQLSYPAMLGRLTTGRHALAVAGTHGKSTTVAMAAAILSAAGLDPTVISGGTARASLSGDGSHGHDLLLVEACEYRRNFLHLNPHAAVITGIEPDHFDCYDTPSAVEAAFALFAARVSADGAIIARCDCPPTQRAVAAAAAPVTTFGLNGAAHWQAAHVRCRQGRYAFDLVHFDRRLDRVYLRVPGRHNVLNALAAAALASQSGADVPAVKRGLERFSGLQRRLEHVARRAGVDYWDDYAHHPTEVAAALSTLRQMYPRATVYCIFQPHQIRRTSALLDEFAQSLQNADIVGVTGVFPAREPLATPDELTAAALRLASCVRSLGTGVVPSQDLEMIWNRVTALAAPGDVVVTIGAGDIRKRCDGFDDRAGKFCTAG